MERAGRERYVLAVDRASAELRHAMATHGGLVLTDEGDPLLAAFEELVDAMGAARATQRGDASAGAPSLRLALVVGEVVPTGAGGFEGRAVVDARGLVRLADPGHLLFDDAVATALGPSLPARAVTREVTLSDLVGPIVVHDMAAPPTVSDGARVVRPALPAPLAAAALQPLVGRDAELATLLEQWSRAASGERSVAIVRGESGVGKTRLVAELAARVHATGGLVLYGHCDAEGSVPHRPFVDALRFYFERVDVRAAATALGSRAAELTRLVPELAPALGLPFRAAEEPGADQQQLVSAVDWWLGLCAADAGAVLVIDDVQWAPPPTVALIDHLLASTRPARLLIILLTRDEPPTFVSAPAGTVEVALGPLDEHAVTSLAERRLGRVSPDVIRTVMAGTGGHPLYVVHLLDHLGELGAGQRGVGDGELLEDVGVPVTLQEILTQRLERIDEEHLAVLSRAAVLGDRFDIDVLRAVVGDDIAVNTALAAVAQQRIVEEESAGRWTFSHSLVRAALGARLSAARRARLHIAAADAIEAKHQEELTSHIAELADHLVRAGGDDPRTVPYAAAAGEQALQRVAAHDAIRWFRAGLDAAGPRTDPSTRGALQVGLGVALHRSGDPAGLPTLVAAGKDAAARGDVDQLVRAALASTRGFFGRLGGVDAERVELLGLALAEHRTDDPDRVRLLARLAHEHRFGSGSYQHRELSGAALALARRLAQPDVLIDALTAHQATDHEPELLAERLELTDELVQLADATGDLGERTRARWYRADSLMEAGALDQFDRVVDEAVALAEAAGLPVLHWATQVYRVNQLATSGTLDDAERLANAAHQLGLRLGQADATLFFGGQLYMIRYEQDRLAELSPLFAPFADDPDAIPMVVGMQALTDAVVGDVASARRRLAALERRGFDTLPRDELRLSTLAHAAAAAHRADDAGAAQAVDAALEPSTGAFAFSQGGAIGITGAVAHFRALARLTIGDHDGALELFEQALERHQRTGGRAWINRTRLALAAALVARDPSRARDLATTASGDLAGTGFVALQREARRLLGG